MAYQLHPLLAAASRGALVLLLLSSSLTVFARPGRTGAPVATAVHAITSGASTRITIAGTAPMAYAVRRPNSQVLLVELPGVDATQLASNYLVVSPLVAGLRVTRSTSPDGRANAAVQIALRAAVRERSHMADNDLVLELWPDQTPVQAKTAAVSPQSGEIVSAGGDKIAPAPAEQMPTPVPIRIQPLVTIAPTSPNTTQQSAQGQQYGQPGFVGEPINLNVVNADIRDILNYVTEQYGVNFILDKSVVAVPVTVNVTDVPWNIALDAILRANRLGIETTGNILRVATNEVIAGEVAIQQQISRSRLSNAPLVTEFIRLNYARASGSLASAAGSAGGFAGGATNESFSGGSGGGEQGILTIIARRLSSRGGIEVDSRSNTLIITDVKENIDAVRQLVALLDQPEPQVEIEARIVIASRNFSRDLGVQLAANAFNSRRGSAGSVGTLPLTTTVSNGTNGFTAPSPSNSLAATAANTIIGLTTGIIGTAQISALISAAELKGQAKTIASPRVSALNNRTAQIETGTQVPVVTPQAGAGGASIFTTTFVSVPLRLSVTPQITDAGTVVLRVTAENNSVRLDLANSLGTPGISTQRMQTEVLVPDGGTTVIGGSLIDVEGETQNRTPGISGIPVLGNLFKRKATIRSTDEILFFITPRIYRPDFEGRPTAGRIGVGTRSVTIPQPVPLGNPPTNTPPPNQQPQQQPVPLNLEQQPATTARPDAAVGARP